MSESQKLVDEILKNGLTPHLKALGYKKVGRTFYQQDDELIRVVNVQLSRGNTTHDAKFTINLGVFFPLVREAFDKTPLDDLPKEYDCTLRERIGMLMPQDNDHWWEVTPNSNIAVIAKEVG